jgi:hypothetical protein
VPDLRVQAMCTYSSRHVLGQVLIRGMLKRLTRDCRKVTDVKLIEMLRASLAYVPIPPGALPPFQLRFDNSA